MVVYVIGKENLSEAIEKMKGKYAVIHSSEEHEELIMRSDAILMLENDDGAYSFADENNIPIYFYPQLPKIHQTEIERPYQSREFMKIVMGMYRTHLSKNADYSPANILATGELGLATRLWDKVARLLNLHGIRIEIEDAYFDQHVIDGSEILANIYASIILLLNSLGFRLVVKDIQISRPDFPKYESVDDSFLDLAIYGVIGKIHRAGLWGK